MRRYRLVRALSGVWLVWFTATVLWSPATRVCPIHAPSGAGAGAQANHVASHASVAHHGHGSSTSGPSHDSGRCACPDACRCGAPTTPLFEAAATRSPGVVVASRFWACQRLAFASPVRRAHALPFANGPPASSQLHIV